MATRHVVLCGFSGIGLRIAEQLRRSGEPVVALGEYLTGSQRSLADSWGIDVLAPAGDLSSTLSAAGIADAAAVIAVTGNDLENLEIALLARQLRADLRVVTQLGNVAIGRAMRADGGPGAVLDVAALAAPAIVQACLAREIHDVPAGGELFKVATLPIRQRTTLRHLFGDLAPVAVVRPPRALRRGSSPDQGVPPRPQVFACPGRDFEVVPGDRAAMLGTLDDFRLADVDLDEETAALPRTTREGWWRRIGLAAAGVARDFDRGLYKALACLLSLVVVSTVVLRAGYRVPGMSVLDAMYFSVETVATVGYGDFTFINQPPWLRVWAIFLMIAGITTTAVLMAFLADMLISRRINHTVGRRRARSYTDHVVVVGLGAFGISVVAELVAAGRRVVVVERDPEGRFLGEAARLGVPVVFGDATLAATLQAARIDSAAATAVLTSSDMVNIETALAVRDLLPTSPSAGRHPLVLRVFDRSLSATVSARFGFEAVQSTEELAAPWFVGAALGLEVLGSFPVGGETFMIGRIDVPRGSSLAGLAMNELSQSIRVIALDRGGSGGLEHPPRRGTRFAAGDVAYLVGPYEEMLGVLRRARSAGRDGQPMVSQVAHGTAQS